MRRTEIFSVGLLVAFAFAVTVASFAQESGPASPEATEILVPELILQVEELAVEQVQAVLPGDAEPPLRQMSLPLPGSEELFIGDTALSIPGPGQGGVVATPETSVFSTGRLGAGTRNLVLGEISLYKLGTDPRLRLQFSHEGIDGYHTEPAGTGFFSRADSLDAWIDVGGTPFSFVAEGAFAERENGLQGLSDYFSVALRRITASGELRYQPDPLLDLRGRLDAASSTRLQSTAVAALAPSEREYVIEPRVAGRASISVVDLSLSTGYFLRFMESGGIPLAQELDAVAGIEVEAGDALTFTGSAGVVWDLQQTLSYPWSLSMRAVLGDILDVTLSGGFRRQRHTLGDLWMETPLLAVGDSAGTADLVVDGQWFAGVDSIITGIPGLTFRSSAELVIRAAAVEVQAYDTTNDEFPFVQRQVQTLYPSISAIWRALPGIQLEAGWRGAFLETVAGEPGGTVSGAIRFGGEESPIGLSVEAQTGFFPEPELPRLYAEGSFTVGQGVDIVLELNDLLAPISGGPRASFGRLPTASYPFIEPGFRAALFTRISL